MNHKFITKFTNGISVSTFTFLLVFLLMGVSACKKDKTPEPANAQFRTDVETILEFNAVKQGVMIDIVKTMSDDYTKKIGEGTYTYAELDAIYSKLNGLQSYKESVELASSRLESDLEAGYKGNIVESRGVAGKLGEFWGWLAGTSKNSRERIITVSSNLTEAERTTLYNGLRPEWKSQTTSQADYWQKLQQGKFDYSASQMYNDMYHNGNTNFDDVAMDKNLTPGKIFVKEGAEGVTKGAEVMIEVTKTVAPGLGKGIELVEKGKEYTERINTLYTNPKKGIADEVKNAIANKLGGFIDIDGAVDAGKISSEMGTAIKILTDFTLGSDDPSDWVKNAIDLGLGKVLDGNKGNKADIVIGVKSENNKDTKVPSIVISVDPKSDDTDIDDVVDIMLPAGEWVITAINSLGISDKVITEIIKNIATVIPMSTEANGSHTIGQISLSVWLSPADPGPGQGVTVTAKVSPAKANEDIFFSIVGTDGYSNSSTKATDTEGKATFYIPGGAEGVRDEVTIRIESNGVTRILNYTF